MFYQKSGYPSEGELVVCTITKIHYHSVFAKLTHYPGKSGLLHISEIAPGRIRNINEYVKEGKVVVLKVLRIHEDKGHIDLSLRRVSDSQRIKVMSELKLEQKAEKIIEDCAKECKVDPKSLYDMIQTQLADSYDYIYDFFYEASVHSADMSILKLDDKVHKHLEILIKQRIKQPMVELKGKLRFFTYQDDGVNLIREVLGQADQVDEQLTIRYAGAGTYVVRVITQEFKQAEKIMDKALAIIEKASNSKTTFMKFEREEGKALIKN